jgi:hypothetical protein
MDIKVWLQKRKDELALVGKYFPPILKDSIISSLFWWSGALGFGFIAVLIALAITYRKDGMIEMDSFFPPNFGWGVLIVLALLFLYQLIIETAKYLDKYRIGSDKFTWNDVKIKIIDTAPDSFPAVGLVVTNNKPYDIQKVFVQVTKIERNWFSKYNESLPVNLPFFTKKEDDAIFDGVTLHKDGADPVSVTVAGWNVEMKLSFLVTEPLGSYDLEDGANYRIKLQWFGEVDNHQLDKHEKWYTLVFDGKKIHLKEV